MTETALIPELDDISFDDLVEDGRGLIPRYAPDWTDHNLHDPGITLIDLIAFLVDNQVYRIGVVGDSLRRAFTRLLGVRETGPAGARLLIWPMPDSVPLDLQRGARIDSQDLPDASFTLDEDIRMIEGQGGRLVDEIWLVTGPDKKALGDGLTEGRDPVVIWPHSTGGPRSLELKLVRPVPHDPAGGFLSLGLSLRTPPSEIGPDWDDLVVEQYDSGGFWRRVESRDLTGGLRRTGVILFKPHAAQPLSRLRLRLDTGFRPGVVTIERLAMNVLPATEGRDVDADETPPLAEGTGLPDQEVPFDTRGIVDRDGIEIFSASAQAVRSWIQVADFGASGPQDAHVQVTETGLRFGNGLNGMVVPRGEAIRLGAHRRTCGTAGAVARGIIWRRAGEVLGSNVAPSSPGKDRDSLSDLMRRARGVAKDRGAVLRSATAEALLDGSALGLGIVRAVPLRRPGLDDVDIAGHRTILVIPARDPDTQPPPPDLALRDAVAGLLDAGRPLGERFHVSLPTYRQVDVAVTLLLEGDADVAAVSRMAEMAIRQRLWDLRRDPDQRLAPWQPGRPVTTGEIAAMMADIAPVLRVTECRIGDGEGLGTAPIRLSDREIALARGVEISASRIEEGAAP